MNNFPMHPGQYLKTKYIDTKQITIVALSNRHRIFYLLRPYLKDKNDDFILELAFSSSTDYIVTYNTNNFKRAKSFGINTITPKDFLQTIGEI